MLLCGPFSIGLLIVSRAGKQLSSVFKTLSICGVVFVKESIKVGSL